MIGTQQTLNIHKIYAILSSKSKNAQVSCPEIYFNISSTRQIIKRIKPGESVRFLEEWLDTQLSLTDYHNIITEKNNPTLINIPFCSNKIYKIETIQKKAIILLIGLPRLSHTSEAFFGVLNILPFSALCLNSVGRPLISHSLALFTPSNYQF